MSFIKIKALIKTLTSLTLCAEAAKPSGIGRTNEALQHALSEAQLVVVKAIIKEIS